MSLLRVRKQIMGERMGETVDTLMKQEQWLASTVSFSYYKTLDLETNMRNRSKVGMKFCKSSTLVIGITNMGENKQYPFLGERL